VPDWWVVAKDPDWEPPQGSSRMGLGGAGNSPGSGGMKIGAGGKPQPYGEHGLYSSTGGGSTGPEFRGKVMPPNEIRGKAGPRPRAKVTWANDERGKPDPEKGRLQPQMQEAVERIQVEVPKMDSLNVNSGRRPFDPAKPGDPHAVGRAVDINNINGVRVVDLKTASGPEAARAREAAANLESWAEGNDDVRQLIGPNGGWTRTGPGEVKPIDNHRLIYEHRHHYHIGM